jgi:hypothetical protein
VLEKLRQFKANGFKPEIPQGLLEKFQPRGSVATADCTPQRVPDNPSNLDPDKIASMINKVIAKHIEDKNSGFK